MKAVITGDIIQSTQLTLRNKKMLIDSIDHALKQWSKDYLFQYEIYRGDSFQCLLTNTKDALRVTLLIKTFIKSLNPGEPDNTVKKRNINTSIQQPVWEFDVRLAIGIGDIETLERSLGRSNGSAFVLSGHTLDELKSKKQAIGIATQDNYQDELETEMMLLDHIVSRMTALQSEVICRKLLEHTETLIANELGINQSAVNQRSNSAGWNAILTLLQRFEKLYANG